MANTVTNITVELGNLLSALEEVFARAASTKAYINFLGWELPPGLEDIGLAGVDFAVFLEKLRIVSESSEEDWNNETLIGARIADLAIAITHLVDEIHHLAEALPARLAGHDNYVSRTNIHKELPRRIFDLLIVGYLTNRSYLVFSILNLLNLVELKHFEADREKFQVEHVRAIVHYDHLHSLLSDPSTHLQKTYGWGTPDLAVLDLLFRIGQVLKAMGGAVRLQSMDPRVEQALLGQPLPDPAAEPTPQLNIHLYEELGAIVAQRLGFSVFGVRPSSQGASDAGIGFLPILRGQAAGAIPLHAFEDTFLEFSGEADLLQRIAFILRPNRPLKIQRASSLGDLSNGRFALGIHHGRPDAQPSTLVNFPGGSSLNIRQFALTAGGEKTSGSASESFLEMSVSGCQIVFSLSEADAFLSSAIRRNRIEASFDLRLGWTASKGIYFHGSSGLQVSLPLHLDVGPIRLESLNLAFDIKEKGFDVEASSSGALRIGPLTVMVDRLGLLVNASFSGGNLGLFDLSPRFKPPNGLGLSIDAPGVIGGGYLRFDPKKEEYSGAVQLEIAEKISVKAIGLLTTKLPGGGKGYSLVVIITAQGFNPIPLGLGFTLTGIGGLLAINRTCNEEFLREGIQNDTLNHLLFPKDPIRNAPQIFGTLNQAFPPLLGSHLFGPVVQICWGTPPVLTMDLALVLELGNRRRLIILGRVSAIMPSEKHDLIRLQMNAFGVIDFDQNSISLDAVLYDSRLVGKFPITGGMAMRLRWGSAPVFALSIGGFHPAFKPPPSFPVLKRLAISLSDTENFRLRIECYLAITSNTLQFGAKVELMARAGRFSIEGRLSFDVLIQFDPFFFQADFQARVQLKLHSHNLFSVDVKGQLSGPRPLHIKGKATFGIFWCHFSVRFDKALVEGERPAQLEAVRVEEQLIIALSDSRNWSGQLAEGERRAVTLREAGAAEQIALHPLGRLSVKQSVVPLELEIAKFGNSRPAGARMFKINSLRVNGKDTDFSQVKDFFAPAQFLDLNEDEKLAAPSFEAMMAGISVGAAGFLFSTNARDILEDEAINYETIIVDREFEAANDKPRQRPPASAISEEFLNRHISLGAASRSEIRRTGTAKYRPAARKNLLAKKGWTIASTEDGSHQGAPGLEAGTVVSYSESFLALQRLKQENPAKAKKLMLIRVSAN
jgi:hypothetical protein